METKRLFLIFWMMILTSAWSVKAQDGNDVDYYTVSGVIKDARTKKTVEYVNISAIGTNIGTVSNVEGVFSLKLSKSLEVERIQLSCIGYYNALINVAKADKDKATFYLTPASHLLEEVQVVSWKNPRDLVLAAVEKVEANYMMLPNVLTGFYRETVQKRRNYIDISEAVIEIYKSPYNIGIDRDQVKVLKGRKLVSSKRSDTLSVKMLGGPNMTLFLDIVKNPELLLEKDVLQYYAYKMDEVVSIDGRLQFVVKFEPQMILPYPLYKGTLYIDRETLSFTRAEFSMDMSDKLKVTEMILRVKPAGLRFTPEEVSYIVTYRQLGEKTLLNYIRNEIRFKCDWKRRLFATNYTVLGETVITDRHDKDVQRMPRSETFSLKQSLTKEVSFYNDENFWSAYNIIEPTESLENAVNRLKK